MNVNAEEDLSSLKLGKGWDYLVDVMLDFNDATSLSIAEVFQVLEHKKENLCSETNFTPYAIIIPFLFIL